MTSRFIVPTYLLLRPLFWFKWICGEEFHCEIPAGSTCDYFAHSDTYTFPAQHGVVPYFSRKTVANNPHWFEPVQPNPSAPERQAKEA
jgi:hypothetical protein